MVQISNDRYRVVHFPLNHSTITGARIRPGAGKAIGSLWKCGKIHHDICGQFINYLMVYLVSVGRCANRASTEPISVE